MISHINHNISAYIRYSVYRECPKEHWEIEKRTIPDHELVYITGGKGEVIIKDKVYKATDRTLFYFHPNIEHAISSNPHNPLRFYAIHFSYTYLDYINDHWEVMSSDKLPLPDYSILPNKQMIVNYLNQINSVYHQKNAFQKIHYNGLFNVLLAVIYQVQFENTYHFGKGKKIDSIMSYINEHIKEKISTFEIASLFNVSPDYLSTLFKKTTGETLMNYINRSKINKAKEMMLEKDMKIQDIADKLNFCDPYYFSKTFKRFEGISPSQYMAKVSFYQEGIKRV